MIQIRLKETTLRAVIETYLSLINSVQNDENRERLNVLLEELGERIFEAPASAKLSYHNCFVGGLAEHSLRVYSNLRKLRDAFAPDITDDSIIIVSLFHDLGKIGSVDQPYFLPQESDWFREKNGEYYIRNKNLDYMGTAHRSLRLLTQYGIQLTDDEYKAIMIHDGQYIPDNKSYAHKEGMLGLLLHQADIIACKEEYDKWESKQ
jgi:hypothetical protein